MLRRLSLSAVTLAALGLLVACSSPDLPTIAPTGTPTVAPVIVATTGPAIESGDILLRLAASGNQARYRVREQLVNVSAPTDAVGATSAVTGSIVLSSNGQPVIAQSKIVVDLTGLKSDRSQRDNYVSSNILQTSTYSTAEFVPVSISGLPAPLPTSSGGTPVPVTFQLSGNLTVHGITRPETWTGTAIVTNGNEMTGTVSTSFTFEDFGLNQPHVSVVLNVVDKVTLELDFHFIKGS